MINILQNWKGSFEINGVFYKDFDDVTSRFQAVDGEIHIVLHPKGATAVNEANTSVKQQVVDKPQEYRITVKKYMTQPSDPGFDFMAKWNNDNPMPLRTMTGIKVKETPGMVYMKLHGDIWATRICTCMKCGKRLTNPVSQYFGIGPECGGHNYVNPFDDDEQLKEAVEQYKAQLQKITWEGWIIKSAITEEVEA